MIDPTAPFDLPPDARLAGLSVARRPLGSVSDAVGVALERFHASWTAHQVIAPTLYVVGGREGGGWVPLAEAYTLELLSWDLVEALVEAFEIEEGARGFLFASEGRGATTGTRLFVVQGTVDGQPHYGALDLETMRPSAEHYRSILDLPRSAGRRAGSAPHG